MLELTEENILRVSGGEDCVCWRCNLVIHNTTLAHIYECGPLCCDEHRAQTWGFGEDRSGRCLVGEESLERCSVNQGSVFPVVALG